MKQTLWIIFQTKFPSLQQSLWRKSTSSDFLGRRRFSFSRLKKRGKHDIFAAALLTPHLKVKITLPRQINALFQVKRKERGFREISGKISVQLCIGHVDTVRK